MSGKTEQVYIARMRECIDAVRRYTRGMDRDVFLRSEMTIDAVCMRIMALSEAAEKLLRLNPSIAENYPEMRWRELTGMRNRMAHDYFGIAPGLVWRALADDMARTSAVLDRLERDFPSTASEG